MLCKQVLPHDSLHIHAKLQQQTADRLNLYRNGGYVGEYTDQNIQICLQANWLTRPIFIPSLILVRTHTHATPSITLYVRAKIYSKQKRQKLRFLKAIDWRDAYKMNSID